MNQNPRPSDAFHHLPATTAMLEPGFHLVLASVVSAINDPSAGMWLNAADALLAVIYGVVLPILFSFLSAGRSAHEAAQRPSNRAAKSPAKAARPSSVQRSTKVPRPPLPLAGEIS